MKKTLMISAAIAMVATPVFAQGMKGADANNDGITTQAEHSAATEARFAKMDSNSDGVINAADREAMKAGWEAKRTERRAAVDADGNGEISLAEMQASADQRMQKRFTKLDTDNNGSLSAAEMAAKHGGHGKRDGKHGMRGGMMRGVDADGDKAISKAEFVTAADKRFAAMDANSDGQVTADEKAAGREKMREMRGQDRS